MVKMNVAALAFLGSISAFASGNEPDSLKAEALNEVVVMGVKVKKDAPFAVANIKKDQLQSFSKSGKELPFLFSRTPGVLAWSENGLGTGTCYMRIRGAGDSRINVTIDGVALNSPEDQCVFWANMNSYASLLGNVQIQRGVGSSTNGDGAFGGTVALQTKAPSMKPQIDLTESYGSYNTMNFGGSLTTGLLWKHFVIDGAYHETNTDGFIHGTGGRSGSYYGGLTFINTKGNLTIRYKNIGNFESTGQAWNGVTAGNDDYSLNTYGGVKSYKDMWNMGLGKFNSLYEHYTENWDDASKGTVERYTMNDGSYWDKTTDNFWQNHNILSMAWQINEHWSLTGAFHYTHGHGYYSEFRYKNKLKKFGLTDDNISKTNFVRKKGLTQDTYGTNWSANYKNDKWDVIAGISGQMFKGNHYGYLTYIADEALSKRIMNADGEYKYYDSDAKKGDQSYFAKATYHILDCLDVFADMQYRHVSYKTDGINDKFYKQEDGTYKNQRLDIDKKYDFFNPKVGFSYHQDGHNAYVSYARSNREPERNNFTDNGSYPAPKAESLNDVELGYSYHANNWYAGANFYYMGYRNQFVQTGEVSDIGENLTTNIKDSYRMGVELTAGWEPLSCLSIDVNAALSQNKIKDFDEVVETYDDDWNDLDPTTNHYDNSTLAFSPSAILNGFLTFHKWGLNATWHTNFVSKQFIDNTQCDARSLPAYTQSDLTASYTFDLSKTTSMRGITIGGSLNNVFNAHYAASAWVYSAIVGKTYPNDNRYYQIGYIPMAGRNVMFNVTLSF